MEDERSIKIILNGSEREAEQYVGGFDLPFLCDKRPPQYYIEGDSISVKTLNGEEALKKGDWVVKTLHYYTKMTQDELSRLKIGPSEATD